MPTYFLITTEEIEKLLRKATTLNTSQTLRDIFYKQSEKVKPDTFRVTADNISKALNIIFLDSLEGCSTLKLVAEKEFQIILKDNLLNDKSSKDSSNKLPNITPQNREDEFHNISPQNKEGEPHNTLPQNKEGETCEPIPTFKDAFTRLRMKEDEFRNVPVQSYLDSPLRYRHPYHPYQPQRKVTQQVESQPVSQQTKPQQVEPQLQQTEPQPQQTKSQPQQTNPQLQQTSPKSYKNSTLIPLNLKGENSILLDLINSVSSPNTDYLLLAFLTHTAVEINSTSFNTPISALLDGNAVVSWFDKQLSNARFIISEPFRYYRELSKALNDYPILTKSKVLSSILQQIEVEVYRPQIFN